jgi:hypothetical protein
MSKKRYKLKVLYKNALKLTINSSGTISCKSPAKKILNKKPFSINTEGQAEFKQKPRYFFNSKVTLFTVSEFPPTNTSNCPGSAT